MESDELMKKSIPGIKFFSPQPRHRRPWMPTELLDGMVSRGEEQALGLINKRYCNSVGGSSSAVYSHWELIFCAILMGGRRDQHTGQDDASRVN